MWDLNASLFSFFMIPISVGNLNLLVSRIQKVVPLTNVLTRLLDRRIDAGKCKYCIEMMNDER